MAESLTHILIAMMMPMRPLEGFVPARWIHVQAWHRNSGFITKASVSACLTPDREEEPGEAAGARHEGGEWRTSGRRVCLFAARRMLVMA